MKKIVLLLCLSMMGYSFSQDFTATAEQEPQLDEYGNVVNNVTDKTGMRQGNWFYLDIDGNQIAKKVYSNDNCQATYILVNNEWLNTKVFSTISDYDKDAIEELKKHGIELNKDRQVLIILDKSGEFLLGELLGNWVKEDETKVNSILKTHLSGLNIKSSSKTYILL